MSVLGDAFSALQSVILMQSRLDQLDQRMKSITDDMSGLTEAMGILRDRVSRLEGFLEGAAAATRAQPPRIEG